jgi:hypothetical protein
MYATLPLGDRARVRLGFCFDRAVTGGESALGQISVSSSEQYGHHLWLPS